MGDEYIADLVYFDFKADKLVLSGLSTVDQKMFVFNAEKLGRMMPVENRCG